ncbi:MAG: membrane protein insertion efficiency factor YidD [Bacteroidales bacterium]|nr:membrane protein insertion efficiency factor YidD [Bacteroidales bacterium]
MQQSLSKKSGLLGLILMIICQLGTSQNFKVFDDLDQISNNNAHISHISKRDFLFSKSNSLIVKYNPLTLVFGSLLFTYQNLISQQLSASCLYRPSCSAFAKEAVEQFGFFKGSLLAADRITRCNQISAHDIHPLKINEQTRRADDPIELYK